LNANDAASLPPLKKILVVQYSQTGQLTRLMSHIIAPLQAEPRLAVRVLTLQLRHPFPFPWPFLRFLDAFPESAHLVPPELAPMEFQDDEAFDLVVLAYQVWFLAPSQPMTAWLKHPLAERLLRGKPVVSVIACRNMWLTAYDKFQTLLSATGAHLIDNVVLTDPSPTLATFITTPRWLLRGKKNSFWGLPAPGLSERQILGSRRFGQALRTGLLQDLERRGQSLLTGLGAVQVDPRLYISERAGTRSFFLWGKLLMAAGPAGAWQRVPLLLLYTVFLVLLIATVVPVSLALQAALRPLMGPWLSKIKAHYEQPSGSSTDRCHTYED
jgi:hypothetical protein